MSNCVIFASVVGNAASNLTRTVTIESTFGSDLQRDFAMRTLTELLTMWKREVETGHKKNKLTITEE